MRNLKIHKFKNSKFFYLIGIVLLSICLGYIAAVKSIGYLLLLFGGGLILCLIIKAPIFGVCGLVFSLWMIEALTFETLSGGLTLNRLLGLMIFLSILGRVVILKKKFYFSRLGIFLVLYLIVAMISIVLSGDPSDTSLAYIRSVVGGILLYLFVTNTVEKSLQLRYLALTIVIASVIVAISGLQQLLGSEKILLRYKSLLVGGVGSFGLYSLWGVPFSLHYLKIARGYLRKVFWVGIFTLLSTAVIISGYRTGIIGLSLMILMLINRKAIGRSFVILSIVAIVLSLIVSQLIMISPLVTKRSLFLSAINAETRSKRIQSSLKSIEMFADRPLFGIGFGNYRHVAPLYWSSAGLQYPGSGYVDHNLYTTTLAEIGLIGLLVLLAILLYSFRILKRTKGILLNNRDVNNASLLSPISILFGFYCFLEAIFHQMYLRRDFFLVLALVVVIGKVAGRKSKLELPKV